MPLPFRSGVKLHGGTIYAVRRQCLRMPGCALRSLMARREAGPPARSEGNGAPSRSGCRRSCVAAILLIGLPALIFLLLPYRSETVVGIVYRNRTGCTIDVTQISGWRDEKLGPALYASNVAYPLEVFVFVHRSSQLIEGRPYSAELIAAESGEVIAREYSCGASSTGAILAVWKFRQSARDRPRTDFSFARFAPVRSRRPKPNSKSRRCGAGEAQCSMRSCRFRAKADNRPIP